MENRQQMINHTTHKIDAIKALRSYCLDTFGVTPGLKESKDFIEALPKPKLTPDQVLNLCQTSALIHPTGSRFFGTANSMSDWDFFTSHEAQSLLESWGFKKTAFEDYNDSLTLSVYENQEAGVHVQIVSSVELKRQARDLIKKNLDWGFRFPECKIERCKIWNNAIKQVRGW